MSDNRIEELADRVEMLAADLDDLMFDRLSEAVADGSTTRPVADKRLTQARRALEKAHQILRTLADSPGE
ncbi:MAG: hypothetical protein CSA55_04940 [Ilumatobacter coccineus]|uniref:Uncharacterized protein n=1 Tax=Ilumatobacter coccineus TaxID=467094 RepID=A0A2G6K7Z1_9ACTN|nr:MAG: hypothetical protein CSA55_04940 [Ilumatobacter coccineus]